MLMHRLAWFGLSLACIGLLPADVSPSLASTPAPIELAQDELAQDIEERVGQVNPNRPIRIEILNAGDASVIFSLTEPVSTQRQLPPRGEIAFGTTHTSFLPPPVYLLAYPETTEIGVNLYVVSTANNVIEIVVGEQISDIPGGRALTIEEDGSIYIF